jgi:hypothetical protein
MTAWLELTLGEGQGPCIRELSEIIRSFFSSTSTQTQILSWDYSGSSKGMFPFLRSSNLPPYLRRHYDIESEKLARLFYSDGYTVILTLDAGLIDEVKNLFMQHTPRSSAEFDEMLGVIDKLWLDRAIANAREGYQVIVVNHDAEPVFVRLSDL